MTHYKCFLGILGVCQLVCTSRCDQIRRFDALAHLVHLAHLAHLVHLVQLTRVRPGFQVVLLHLLRFLGVLVGSWRHPLELEAVEAWRSMTHRAEPGCKDDHDHESEDNVAR